MTSRKSFWANSRENHKRRIWIWIVAVLAQLMAYVGVLTVYLSRINRWNREDRYKTPAEYKSALCQAAQDALGFQDNLVVIVVGLAVIIGMQGFSYLYDRKKVDLYHSVPVNRNKRFAVIYINGIIIYLTGNLVSLMIGVIVAAVQGAVSGPVMAVIGLGFIWNLLFFLAIYHISILAVMLTGNQFVGLGVAGTLIMYELVLYYLINSMQSVFFKTASGFYVPHVPKLSVLQDYFGNTPRMKYTEDVKELLQQLLPYYGKWFILAVVILAAAWVCYRKRPSEAAGQAMTYPVIGQIIKVAVVIPVSLGLGMWVHNAAYGSTALTLASMIGSGVIVSAAAEVIFDFDIKSLLRHPVTSGIAVAGILFVFLIFRLDLFGYDMYLPNPDKLESIAVNVDYYGDFWNKDFDYVQANTFSEKHMFIKDMEPVLALADKARGVDKEDMKNPVAFNVLYRLKSGRKVGRYFSVDIADPDNVKYLDRIVGSQEFKNGTWQIVTDRESYDQVLEMSYSNGAAKVALPTADAQALRDAYLKDMEQYDFSMASTQRPCGQISFRFAGWMAHGLDVYESYENTITYLKSQDAYYPVKLNPEDIENIMVTNYHYELSEQMNDRSVNAAASWNSYAAVAEYVYEEDLAVSENFYDQEQFAQILPVIYPSSMHYAMWHDPDELDRNYEVYITLKKDTTYPYERGSYGTYYKFYTGQVPEFVVQATAIKNGTE